MPLISVCVVYLVMYDSGQVTLRHLLVLYPSPEPKYGVDCLICAVTGVDWLTWSDVDWFIQSGASAPCRPTPSPARGADALGVCVCDREGGRTETLRDGGAESEREI